MRRSIFLFVLMILFSTMLTGCTEMLQITTDQSVANGTIKVSAHQVTVIDGDTIKVQIRNQKVETVRLLLIDTPESKHPRLGKQPYSEEAKQFLQKMIRTGKKVTIELGTSKRDKYDRLLGYVYVDGKSVQAALLKNGLARVAYVFEPNTKHIDEYRKFEKVARDQKINIWSVDHYVQNNGFHPDVFKRNQTHTNHNTPTESGFVASKNSKVYHPASCKQVIETIKPQNRIYFKNENEAKASGRKRSQVEKCWNR